MKSDIIYRQLIALIFFAGFLAQTFSRTFVIADYYANTAAYAKACENKAKPMMHCNGKCQMMKKLKQEEKKEEQNPERKADNKNEIIISAKSFFASLCLPERRLLKSNVALLQTGKEIKMPRFVFHPPAV